MNGFIEKIDWEYQMFYLDTTRTSKANIFAKSGEIEMKKSIIQSLKKSFKERKENEQLLFEKLSGCDNVLDEVYRYISDSRKNEMGVQLLVDEWLSTIH